MKQLIDKLRGYACTPTEARTLYYLEHGLAGPRPTDEQLRAIRLNPDLDRLAGVRNHGGYDLMGGRD